MSKFKPNDFLVYPGHGVGKVTRIETREILGSKQSMYAIELIDSGMKLLVPCGATDTIGVRPVISRFEASRVKDILALPPSVQNQSWSVSYRLSMEKIKSGSIFEIAECIRDLRGLKDSKELSFGERKMLDNAKTMLNREMSIVDPDWAIV